jgi:hypothetical protein
MPGSSGRGRRFVVALIVMIGLVGGLTVAARALWHTAQSVVRSDGCDFGSTTLEIGQSEVAATMVSVVVTRELPERAAVLTLAAAMQESKLRNIPAGHGDRDSVGVLQQRPSQGWGSAKQIADVRYATGRFLDALVKVANWRSDDLASVIQAVQRSADGTAYAKHEVQAQSVADGLTGTTAAGVSCRYGKPTVVGTATALAARVATELPVAQPTHVGRTVTVPSASWATVAWLITHGDTYGLDSVSFAGKQWARAKGWRDDPSAVRTAVVAQLAP